MRAPKLPNLLLTALLAGVACVAFADNLGPDDLQVTQTGAVGTGETDAVTPAVAFDSSVKRYLLVWSADEADGDFLIYGQLLSGAGGMPVGPAFAISPAGPAGTDHRQPAVAYSPVHGHYLVAWSSDILNVGAYEIMGQLVTSDGQLSGPLWRYSDMGTVDSDPAFDAITPDLAWHPFLDMFTLAWAADDDPGDLDDGRFEIYGQLLDGASGAEIGTNDFRISFSLSGPVQNDILEPTVAVHPDSDRWFVAFEADVTDDLIHEPEIWMYGCTTDVPDPSAVPLSYTGGSYFDSQSAHNPDLAWVESSGELVCVWDAEADGLNGQGIFGQRVQLNGTLADGMIAFSDGAGTVYGNLRESTNPTIKIDPVTDEWFVAWRGDLNDGVPHFDHEVWARRFDDVGSPVDAAAFSLSMMDPSLGPVAGAGSPAVAVNSDLGHKLIAWSGDLDSTLEDEHEIFVQAWSDDGVTGVDDAPAALAFNLHGAAPNPFNPTTTISFDLPAASPVSLNIYDASGRLVRRLLSGEPQAAGRNEVLWNGRDDGGRQAASGVYLFQLETMGHQGRGRMTLVK